MEGAKGKASQKKQKTVGGESSGEDGALQIDVGKKTGGKKQADGAKGGKVEEGWTVGDLVWAKVSGFVHWPAKVFDPTNELIPDYLKDPPKPNYSLVRFLGTYDIQWASSRQIESYEKGLKKRLHTKSRSKLFAKALAEAKHFLDSGELPKGMEEKPKEEEEEEDEEEEANEESVKAPAKAGTKRKTTGKSEGTRHRKVKVVSDTDEGSDSTTAKEKEEIEKPESKEVKKT